MSEMQAKYTMTFYDLLSLDPDFISNNLKMSTDDRTNNLVDALKAQWSVYEISGETIGEFKLFLVTTFNEYKRYYEEMLDNYDKEFDYREGIIRKTSLEGSVTNEDKSIYVDLPNKKIDESDIYAYPSSGNKDNGKTMNNSTSTTTNNADMIRLRVQYLSQIRDLYRDFALKFSDCFIHIY